ncbi:hypothetical protein VN97_g9856 [Penicillium thymicola]|uniref:Uncharacterized protein n=1 Tax=Penicillium thymicola TaxID=293382 RepID=A0AAI9TAK7_PENTH|nr:hypothetical protein VN97_g9856 [Penicillium thymicola]
MNENRVKRALVKLLIPLFFRPKPPPKVTDRQSNLFELRTCRSSVVTRVAHHWSLCISQFHIPNPVSSP